MISTASLAVGVAAASPDRVAIQLAAVAGLVAGALSMAAGEYVSVGSQADTERADLARERGELAADPSGEHAELTAIYEGRGLSRDLARQVATELTARDALAAHARDELGLTEFTRARPLQAAAASAAAFASGAALPLVLVATLPMSSITVGVTVSSVVLLFVLGGLAARLGGAPGIRGAVRVAFWGLVAMIATMGVGRLFGAPVG